MASRTAVHTCSIEQREFERADGSMLARDRPFECAGNVSFDFIGRAFVPPAVRAGERASERSLLHAESMRSLGRLLMTYELLQTSDFSD